ncbi:MAG: hypothetical protein V4577_11540 [Bacteroidota bacterium]
MKTKFLKYGVLGIAAMVWGVTAQAQVRASNGKAKKSQGMHTSYSSQTNDNNGDEVQRIETEIDGKEFKIKLVNDKIVSMYVDDEKVAPADYGKYETQITEIREQIKRDRIQAEKDRHQADLDRQQADRDRAQAEKDRHQADLDRQQADRDRVQAEKDRHQADLERQQADGERGQVEKDRQQAERDRHQADLDREQAGRDRIQADKDRAQAEIDRKHAEEDRKVMAQLINDLVSDKIIPNEDALHNLTMDDDEMTVNGKKQPDAVFNKYKEKYKRFAGGEFSYENSYNGTSHRRGIHMSRN